jgi:hypothetical protein
MWYKEVELQIGQRILNSVKYLVISSIIICFGFNVKAQQLSLSVGTDIPYQHYLGTSIKTTSLDISYRTGVLLPPYSDAILTLMEELGVNEIYTKILEEAFSVGWMNGMGAYYRFSENKSWYLGGELRLDYLTAAKTSSEQIENATGSLFTRNNVITRDQELDLGLLLYALGVRMGKSFSISKNNKHLINIELSFSKHLASQTYLTTDSSNGDEINQVLDDLFWEDVFSKYGYIGGLGISYAYTFF